jgi:uncharacterized protein (TIGR00299 family) protein
MKILYFDCFSGISGDMTMGALLDAGGDAEALQRDLDKLNLGDAFHLHISRALKNGVMCTHVDVATDHVHGEHEHEHDHDHGHEHEHEHHHAHDHENAHDHDHHEQDHAHAHVHRGLADVTKVIEESGLEEAVKVTAKRIFTTLAQAEAKMHGTTVDEVHFHEVGAIDAIVDVVGASILIHQLAPDVIACSKVNVGSGYVQCAHGLFPVPAPAVAEILCGAPYFMGPGKGELCTPTGAAIVRTLCSEFGRMPVMEVERIGYGAGKREMETLNALRVFIGHDAKKA